MAGREDGWRDEVGIVCRQGIDDVKERALCVMESLPVGGDQ